MSGSRGKRGLLVLTAIAAPAAFGVETLLRKVLLPPDFEEVRAFLEPAMTLAAWVLVGLSVLAGVGGFALQQRLAAKKVAALPADAPAEVRERAILGAFMLTASVPQLPAIFATFTFMFGARLTPVAVAIAVSTLAVLTQTLRAWRTP